MRNRIFHYSSCLVVLAGALWMPSAARAQEPGGGGSVSPEQTPEVAQEVAQEAPSAEELEAARVAYLAPLQAEVANEAAFVDRLESMGDMEIMRLEALENHLRQGVATREEALTVQREIGERRQYLAWLCEAGLTHYAENARVRNFRGNVFYDNFGKFQEAVSEWYKAISLDSSYSQPYNNLGMHFLHEGKYPLGYQNMDKALELEPDNPDFCFNMAQNYLIFIPQTEAHRGWSKKRLYKEAMKLSRRAVKNAPEDYQLLEDYAVNFLAAQNFGVKADWKDAAKAWEAAREHAPNDVKRFYTWLNEGRAWKEMGRKADARRCLEKAREIIPDNDVVLRLLEDLNDA